MFNNSFLSRLERKRASRHHFLLIIVTMLAVAGLMAGCSKGYSRFMKLPVDPQVDSELGWATVTAAYAQAKKLPDSQSRDVAVVRRGTVFRCSARMIDPQGQDLGGFWYKYGEDSIDAWIHSTDLSIFPSEEQARAAAASLQKD